MNQRTDLYKTLLAISIVTSGYGCWGNPVHYKTGAVRGTLTCQGTPVPGVNVVFTPHPGKGRDVDFPGKSGMGRTDKDGNFVISTYVINDGAVVGSHTVSIFLDDNPENPFLKEGRKLIKPCADSTQEVEIKPGKNEVSVDF